jgi:hypothetical protein
MENITIDSTQESNVEEHTEGRTKTMIMELICEVVLMIIVGIFGVVGNLMSITMFSRLKKKQLKFHRLMILLALFDTAYILSNILVFVVPGVSEEYKSHGYHFLFAPTVMPITQIALTGSVYCTMAISIERYLTVCHPFYTASKNWSSKRYIIPIVLFSIIYNLPRFFELRWEFDYGMVEHTTEAAMNLSSAPTWQLEEVDSDHNTEVATNFSSNPNFLDNNLNTDVIEEPSFTYGIALTKLRRDKYYYCSILILNITFMGIGPFMLLFLLNGLTLRKLIVYSRQDNMISPPHLQNFYIARDSTLTTNNETLITNDHGTAIQIRKTEDHLNPSPSPLPSPCSQHRSSFVANQGARPSVHNPFTISKRLKTNEIVLSKVSLIISLVFIICHSIRFVPNIYELIARIHDNQYELWPDWIECFTYLSHLLTVFSASVNFYIYYFARYEIKSVSWFSGCISTKQNSPAIRLMEL